MELGSPVLVAIGLFFTGAVPLWMSASECASESDPAPLWVRGNRTAIAAVLLWDLLWAYVGGSLVFGAQKAAQLNLTETFNQADTLSRVILGVGVAAAATATGISSRRAGAAVLRRRVRSQAVTKESGTAVVRARENPKIRGLRQIGDARDEWTASRAESAARSICQAHPGNGRKLVAEAYSATRGYLSARASNGQGLSGKSLGMEGGVGVADLLQRLREVIADERDSAEDKVATCLLLMLENGGVDAVDRFQERKCGRDATGA